MRVVAFEEHFTVPALAGRIDPAAIARGGFRLRRTAPGVRNSMQLAPEIGEKRPAAVDAAGITVQVLSNILLGPRAAASCGLPRREQAAVAASPL